jgi:signal transduction histidine kinase
MSSFALVNSARTAPSAATQWAHDIRNTLATVGLHLDALERLAGAAGRRSIEAAHALMMRATSMCEQALARPAPAQAAACRRPVDVVATVRQIAELLDPVAPEGFAIHIPTEQPIAVMADPGQLFRVIFNLLQNSVGVARRHGTLKAVHVTAERTGAMVAIRIADDGPGLPARIRRHLFRPVESSTGGCGFGLAIARELTETNGGTLTLAKSGKGAAFMLELPAPSSIPSTRSAGGSILGGANRWSFLPAPVSILRVRAAKR